MSTFWTPTFAKICKKCRDANEHPKKYGSRKEMYDGPCSFCGKGTHGRFFVRTKKNSVETPSLYNVIVEATGEARVIVVAGSVHQAQDIGESFSDFDFEMHNEMMASAREDKSALDKENNESYYYNPDGGMCEYGELVEFMKSYILSPEEAQELAAAEATGDLFE